MIETETLLEKCPRCGAWPLAAKLSEAISAQIEIRLTCSHCGYQEGGRLGQAGNVRLRAIPQAAR